jgi:F0F1-type ATP synthase assembly protein I
MSPTPRDTVYLEEESLGQLFSDMSKQLSDLVRKEVQLAKVETKEEISRAGKAGGQLGAAALCGYLAAVLFAFTLGYLLDEIMPLPLAFAIVTAVFGIAAYVLAQSGRQRLKTINPVPEQTVDTLKEDAQWLKNQKK